MSVPINIEIIGFSSLKNDCLVLAPLFFLIMSGAFFVLHKKKTTSTYGYGNRD